MEETVIKPKKQIKTAFLLLLCVMVTTAALNPAAVAAGATEPLASKTAETKASTEAGAGMISAEGETNDNPNGQNPRTDPGEEALRNEAETKPGDQTSDNEAEAKPGDQTSDSEAEAKPGDQTSDSEAEAKPGDQTLDEKEETKPGDQTSDEKEETKPGDQTSDEKEETKPDDQKPEEIKVSASVKLTESKKAVIITWKKVKGAVSYKVQRSSKKKSGFKKLVSVKDEKRSYTDKTVEKGNRYYYRVVVKMEDGSSHYSDALLMECPLSQVSGVELIRYSSTSIKVTWNKSKDEKAKWYKVYYAKKKDGTYQLAGTTKNNWYRVKGLKENQSYYFRVEACVAKTSSGRDSEGSEAVGMKTKSYQRTTIFAGDSITAGFTSYGILDKIKIGGKKKVVAAIGLNTMTFRTKRVFDGKSGVESIVQSKPYRVYIMLGVNDIHYRKKEDLIDGYREIVTRIQSGSPKTDIVILAATPVTAAEKNNRTGFAQIPAYNKGLKALAVELGVRYYDCTDFMKDSSGWLKKSYAAADGIHWKASVYEEYAKRLEEYDKSLD